MNQPPDTDTPRTDAQVIDLYWTQQGYKVSRPGIEAASLVPAQLARTLERELAAAQPAHPSPSWATEAAREILMKTLNELRTMSSYARVDDALAARARIVAEVISSHAQGSQGAGMGELRAQLASVKQELATAREEQENQAGIIRTSVMPVGLRERLQLEELAALRARLTQLEQDSKRLDWLEAHPLIRVLSMAPNDCDSDRRPLHWVSGFGLYPESRTVRAAIDAAIATPASPRPADTEETR